MTPAEERAMRALASMWRIRTQLRVSQEALQSIYRYIATGRWS